MVTTMPIAVPAYAAGDKLSLPAPQKKQEVPSAHDIHHNDIPVFKRRPYFGELHLHTSMSLDAWALNTKTTPDQAYRFGRGETILLPAEQVGAQQGVYRNEKVRARRAWPLDFMAVTDHSESMGVFNQLDDPKSTVSQTPFGRRIRKDPTSLIAAMMNGPEFAKLMQGMNVRAAMLDAWAIEIKAANDNYIPGKFTTLIAYEWSSMNQGKYNLHRNVFFNSDRAPPPFTSNQSNRPEDLWTYIEKVRANGIDAIAIPHNGNVSGGLMYDWNDSDGRAIDERYAQRRALNEPLTEIVQTKGQSETIPALSPNDEFADFEIFDNLLVTPGVKSNPDGSYIRQALGRGLAIQSRVGVNPFKYGFVGGSDIHNGLSASDENAFAGSMFGIDPRTMLPSGDAARHDLQDEHFPVLAAAKVVFGSAGLTGVWAEENTRNAIFAALKRKETFATSGTRIRIRMFGGWNFNRAITASRNWVATAYATGVPMGSDLPAKSETSSGPQLILQAMKDPDGANLDRIQVVKLWLEDGSYKEKIFNVVLSGGRQANVSTARAPTVGDTVDLRKGTYRNTIGAAVLTAVWQDPQFNPKCPAVYYARVLEIPTPRWTTLLAIRNGLPIPKTVPATIQERAWTSPLWYTPE